MKPRIYRMLRFYIGREPIKPVLPDNTLISWVEDQGSFVVERLGPDYEWYLQCGSAIWTAPSFEEIRSICFLLHSFVQKELPPETPLRSAIRRW